MAMCGSKRLWGERMRFFKFTTYVLAALLMPQAYATHLGHIGNIYPIGEQSALTFIMNKLQDKERSGELKRLQQEAIRRSVNGVKHMPPVPGITTAHTYAKRWIDPTVTYTKAVKTDEGRIVIPAGTKINPLSTLKLSKRLVFFDGRDAAQREAVGKLIAQTKSGTQHAQLQIKPILIAGSWLEMTKAWKTQVYYDQHGSLSKRFGIRATPTVISQQGQALLLEEIPAEVLR